MTERRRLRRRLRAITPQTLAAVSSTIVVSVGVLFLSTWLAATGAECGWPSQLRTLPVLVWVIVVLPTAVFSLPMLDAVFTQQVGKRGLARQSIAAGALSLALIVATLLSIDATFSGIVLVYYFGPWLVADYLRRLLLRRMPSLQQAREARKTGTDSPLRSQGVTTGEHPTIRFGQGLARAGSDPEPRPKGLWLRAAAHFDDAPHAPFIMAAMFLIVISTISLIGGREASAERIANWAFGLLVLGVGMALLNEVAWPEKIRSWIDNTQGATLIVGLFVFLLAVGSVLAREEAAKAITSPLPEAVVSAEKLAKPGDVILGINLSYPLRCAYRGSGAVKVLATDEVANIGQELKRWLSERRRIFVLYPGSTLPDQVAITLRQLKTAPWQQLSGSGLVITVPISAAPTRSVSLDVGAYSLKGEFHPDKVGSADILNTLARMQKLADSEQQNAGLVLLDDQGYAIVASFAPIVDTNGVPAPRWRLEEPHDVQFNLPVPIGTTPLDYTLAFVIWPADAPRLRVGRPLDIGVGNAVSLGRVSVVRPEDVAADPYGTLSLLEAPVPSIPKSAIQPIGPATLGLVAYGFDVHDYQPGEHLYLTLVWRGQAVSDLPVHIRLMTLRRGYNLYDGPPAGGRYPFNQRAEGEYGVDHYDLILPADLPEGQSVVQVAVGDWPFRSVAYVVIRPGPRDFAPPRAQYSVSATFGGVAELVGYDLSDTELRAGRSLTVTIYWKAISAQPVVYPYTVFVHLTGEDSAQLIAQHDSPPADGTRPTTDWVLGETIRDVHVIPIPAGAPAGKAWLNVGLYRSDTLERLPLRGEEEIEWRLPTAVVVRR